MHSGIAHRNGKRRRVDPRALNAPRRGLVERLRPCLNETDLNLLNVYDDARLVARAAPRAALTALVKPEFRAPIGAPAPNPSYAAHTQILGGTPLGDFRDTPGWILS